MNEIAGGQRFLGVAEDAGEPAFGGAPERRVHARDRGRSPDHRREVDRGHVQRGHAHRLRLEAPGQLGQHAPDAGREPGVDRNHRLQRGARLAQVRVVVGVQHRLVVHRGVDRGDHAALQPELARQRVDHRHDAVGGAGSRRDHPLVAAQQAVVDAVDDGRVDVGVRGLREHHPPRATPEVLRRAFARGEGAGAFEHQVHAVPPPVQPVQRLDRAHRDLAAVDHERAGVRLDLSREAPVRGVVAREIRHGLEVRELVDRDHVQPSGQPALVRRAQQATPDASVPVDRCACCHAGTFLPGQPEIITFSRTAAWHGDSSATRDTCTERRWPRCHGHRNGARGKYVPVGSRLPASLRAHGRLAILGQPATAMRWSLRRTAPHARAGSEAVGSVVVPHAQVARRAVRDAGPSAAWMPQSSLQGRIHGVSRSMHARLTTGLRSA